MAYRSAAVANKDISQISKQAASDREIHEEDEIRLGSLNVLTGKALSV